MAPLLFTHHTYIIDFIKGEGEGEKRGGRRKERGRDRVGGSKKW